MTANYDKRDSLEKTELKIREIRRTENLSIQEFADKLDIEYNNLIRIEKGRTNPTITTYSKLLRLFRLN